MVCVDALYTAFALPVILALGDLRPITGWSVLRRLHVQHTLNALFDDLLLGPPFRLTNLISSPVRVRPLLCAAAIDRLQCCC